MPHNYIMPIDWAAALPVELAYAPFVEEKHPRGYHGKFADKGGTGFASPNVREGLNFKQARANVTSQATHAWVNYVDRIISSSGLKGHIAPAIGDWATGAEESGKIDFEGVQDYDQLKYVMAKIGRESKQLAVLPFIEDEKGKDIIWEIDANDKIESVRKILDQNGIQFRTLIDQGEGRTKIVIFDQGGKLSEATDKVAANYGSERQARRGHGEFFPKQADTRQDAAKQFTKFIDEYERKNKNKLGNERGKGQRLHDAEIALDHFGFAHEYIFDEDQHPRGYHGKFSDKGGTATLEKTPKETEESDKRLARSAVLKLVEDGLKSISDPELANQYRVMMHKALDPFSLEGLRRLKSTLKAIKFYDNLHELKKGIMKDLPDAPFPDGQVGGAFITSLQTLNVDGTTHSMRMQGMDPTGIYVHELTHAVDFVNFQERINDEGVKQFKNETLSNTEEWEKIVNDEIRFADPPLSRYLMQPQNRNLSEAFAEFGRLLYKNRDRAEESFPKAWAYWKKLKLV